MEISTEASQLVEKIEAKVAKETYPIEEGKRLILFPAKFLLMGMCEIFKRPFELSLFVCACALIPFMIYSSLLPSRAPELPPGNFISAVVSIVSLLLIAFWFFTVATARDSIVKIDDVAAVIQHLESKGFTTEKEIELLKKSVKPFEDQVRSRVTALKWVVSLIWGGFTYVFIKNAESTISSPAQSAIQTAITIWFFLLPAVYVLVWGLEAALDRLFRAIEFGCNDFCHHAEAKEPKKSYDTGEPIR
jgi:hypothetical protein